MRSVSSIDRPTNSPIVRNQLASNRRQGKPASLTYLPSAHARVEMADKYASLNYLIDRAKVLLVKWCNQLGMDGCEIIVESGSARHSIRRVSEALGVDLIVIEEREDSLVAHTFGSVANAVVRDASCDVLLVRS